jgi:phosphoadenosine phosphosulfate reductase
LNKELRKAGPERIIRKAWELYQKDLVLVTSFQAEGTVLLNMWADILAESGQKPRVISVDTGRLPEETYETAEALRKRFGLDIEWYFPDRSAVEAIVGQGGQFAFKNSLADRKTCCRIRKVEPLNRALQSARAWLNGRRRDDGETRAEMKIVEADPAHPGLVKFNPLAGWSTEHVWKYIRALNLPYNALYDRGYQSIGCACCTRTVRMGEPARAGRWWWETPEQKECGIHTANATLAAAQRGAFI